MAKKPGRRFGGTPPARQRSRPAGRTRATAPLRKTTRPLASTPRAVPWPAALDALVAAPDHHRLVLENDRVRVLDTTIAPGDRTPVHTHRWPAAHHVLSWSDFVRRDDAGTVLLDTRVAGLTAAAHAVLWGEPLGPHSLENVGATPLRVMSIEIKGA